MTEHDILDAIGDIDPAYLEEARQSHAQRKIKWVGFGALAACFLMFLIFPFGFRHYFKMTSENDYAPKDCKTCSVYYEQDGELYYEELEVLGAESEMFEVWARKNGVTEAFDLCNIAFEFTQAEDGSFDVIITVPASLGHYFESGSGALRLDSLKRTLASYREIDIAALSIVYL
jgi:hypothetical protein